MQKRQSIVFILVCQSISCLWRGRAGLPDRLGAVAGIVLRRDHGVGHVDRGRVHGRAGAWLAVGRTVGPPVKNTLLVYGLLEMGIAAFGLFSQPLIFWIGQKTAGSPYALVFLISFAILLVPTTLMGMTLPLLTQSFVHRVDTSGSVIGILYGINTLGAAFGTVLAGFVLDRGLRLRRYNQYRGCDERHRRPVRGPAGWLAGRRFPAAGVRTASESALVTQWGYKTILISSFLVGFIGLGFEMLWVRILHIVNKNTAYSFPSILFIFLLGLAIGGYIFGRAADKSKNPILLFCKIEMAGAVLAALHPAGFLVVAAVQPALDPEFFRNPKTGAALCQGPARIASFQATAAR